MFRKSGICLISLVLAVLVSAQADDKTRLSNFERSIESGQLEVERDLFNYVRANPNDANGFSLLARLRFKQDRLPEARALCVRSLELDPRLVSAKLTLAQVWFRLGDLEQARRILNGIQEAELPDDTARLKAARSLAQVGQCPEALSLVQKLSLKVKNGSALPVRGTCYLEAGDKKGLLQLIPFAKLSARQDPNGAIEFAEILLRGRLPKEAADLLRITASVNPKLPAVLLLLAKTEVLLKDFVNAKVHLEAAEKVAPNSAELFFIRSLLAVEQNNYPLAYEWLEKSLSIDSNDAKVLAQYVLVAIQVNQTGRAARAAEKLLGLQPENPDALYLHGIASLQNKNLPGAEVSLTKFMEARPNDSRGCIALGLTYAGQPAKLDTARAQMLKCMQLDPKNFEAAYQLGLSYKNTGDFPMAARYFEQTISISPNFAAALRELGAAYLQIGAEAKARPVLEKAVAIDPNDADAHFQLSRLYNIIGERELAKKHLELFRKLKPTKSDGM